MAKSNYRDEEISQRLDNLFLYFMEHGINDKAIICGGYFLNKMLHSRATVDIDLNIKDPIFWEDFKAVAHSYVAVLQQEFPTAWLDISEPTKDTTARLIYKDESGRKIAGMDVGVNSYDFGIMTSVLPVKTASGLITKITIDSFSYERVLADKLSVAFSIKNARRSKDFYDLYLILKSCHLNRETFVKLLYSSSLAQHPEWVALYSPYNPDRYVGLKKSWDKLELRSADSLTEVEKPELDEVLSVLSNFIYQLATCSPLKCYTWNPYIERWVTDG